MEAAELFCANVTTKYMQQRYVVFFQHPWMPLGDMEIFIFPCSQYQPYASKQAIFFRMSQGRRINVLKLGMNNPSDHDFTF